MRGPEPCRLDTIAEAALRRNEQVTFRLVRADPKNLVLELSAVFADYVAAAHGQSVYDAMTREADRP